MTTTVPLLPTVTDPAVLPDDPATLKSMILELLATLHEHRRDNEQLRQRLDQLLRRLYGPRAERWNPEQPWLFADLDAAPPPTTPIPSDPVPSATPKRGHGRQTLPAHLPRRRVLHDLAEAERACPCCGRLRVCIGSQTSEQLEYQPASLYVLEHVRLSYACAHCQNPLAPPTATVTPAPSPAAAAGPTVSSPPAEEPGRVDNPVSPEACVCTAPKPLGPIPRGLPGPGLLAHVVVSKFLDHLPLHRQEGIFRRHGVHLARSTLADWTAAAASVLEPLYDRLRQRVLQSQVLHTDDTLCPVQDDQRDRLRQGCLWVYCGDWCHPYVIYDFSPTRSPEAPQRFLAGYRGYLQADAYAGYDALYAAGATAVGCWAHARRYFFDARSTAPEIAHHVLAIIRQLYAVEKQTSDQIDVQQLPLTTAWELRRQRRQNEALPLLTSLCQYLQTQQPMALPKSPIGTAINYVLRQWPALTRYVEQGFLAIGRVERWRGRLGAA